MTMTLSDDDWDKLCGGVLTLMHSMRTHGYQVPHLKPMRNLEDVLSNAELIRNYLKGHSSSLSKGYEGYTRDFIDAYNTRIEEIQRTKTSRISADELKKLSDLAVQAAITRMLSITNDNGVVNNQILVDFSEVGDGLKNKLNTIIDNRFPKAGDLVAIAVLLYLLKKAVSEEAYKVDRIITTELQVARNRELELKFISSDPEGKDRYKWKIIRDNVTTSCCKNIDNRVPQEGLPLEKLKAIVNDESAKYNSRDPHWFIRDWSPHVNCRSSLSQVNNPEDYGF